MLDINGDAKREPSDPVGGQGLWWHPISPEIKVSGVFRFTPDEGGHLTTASSLQVKPEFEFNAVIFGEINGILYTLNAGFRSRVDDVTAGPLSRETWICTTVFQGAHLPEGSETQFHSFNLKTDLLAKWLYRPKPSIDRTQGNKRTISVAIPNRIEMVLDEQTSASLAWAVSSNAQAMAASVVLTPVMSVKTSHKNLFDLHDDLIMPIVYLISFCMGCADSITSLELHFYDSTLERDHMVRVLEARWNTSKGTNIPRFPGEYVIKFEEVESKLEEFISLWLVTYRSSRHSFLDYFATLFNDYLYSEEKFLRILRSLESWHAFHSSLTSQDLAEVNRILSTMEIFLEKEDVELIKSKMNQYGDPSLRVRLDDLQTNADSTLRSLLTTQKRFSSRCVATRIRYTHHENKKESFQGEELFWSEQYLRILFVNHVLITLGLNESEIGRNLKRSRLGQLIGLPSVKS